MMDDGGEINSKTIKIKIQSPRMGEREMERESSKDGCLCVEGIGWIW